MILKVPRIKQKEDECASAALLQVLRYYKDNNTNLEDIIEYCGSHFKSRDWDYLLGCFALDKKYKARIHTRSLSIFDSTWFDLDVNDLIKKLRQQKKFFKDLKKTFGGYKKLYSEVKSAIRFLRKGGEIDFSPISENLILFYLKNRIPVIAVFTAQLVYKIPKEIDDSYDDIRGVPWKHTVVINGFENSRFWVVDPGDFQPYHNYSINSSTLIDAIIRYDSNLLIVSKNKLPKFS